MLRAAILFFIMGLLVFLLGIYGIAGVNLEVGKLVLVTFLIFAIVSFIGAVTTGKSKDKAV